MQQTITVHGDYIFEDRIKHKTAMCKVKSLWEKWGTGNQWGKGTNGVQGTNDPQNMVTFQLRNKHEIISVCIYQRGFMMQFPRAQQQKTKVIKSPETLKSGKFYNSSI